MNFIRIIHENLKGHCVFMTRLILWFFVLVGYVLPVYAFQNENDIFILNAEKSYIPIQKIWSALEDPEGRLTLKEVIEKDREKAFKPLNGGLSKGYGKSVYWLKFRLDIHPVEHQQWFLEIEQPYLDDIRFYEQDKNGEFTIQQSGDTYNFDLKSIKSRLPVFTLNTNFSGERVYYIRIKTDSAMMVNAAIYDSKEYIKHSENHTLFLGFMCGVVIVLIGVNVSYFIGTNKYIFAKYVFFLLGFLGWLLSLSGMFSVFLPGEWWRLSDLSSGLFTCLIILSVSILFVDLLKLKERYSWAYFFFVFYFLFSVVCVFATLLGFYSYFAPYIFYVAIAGNFVAVFITLHLLYKKEPGTIYLACAFFFSLNGGLVSLLRALSYIPSGSLTAAIYPLSVLFEAVFLHVFIFAELKKMMAEKERAQLEALTLSKQLQSDLESLVETRTAALTQEIESRQKLQENLKSALNFERRAREAQNSFIAMISHEFGTPLASIDGAAQVLMMLHPNASEEESRRHQRIRLEVDKMVLLIEKCLVLGEMDSLSNSIHPEKINWQILFKEAEKWSRLADLKRIHIDIDDSISAIYGDVNLLRIALSNLIDNSGKYADPSSPVHIKLRNIDKGVELKIYDQGPGIPEEDQHRIFERFHRGRAASSKQSGSGLGLFIVQHIIHLHGGEIVFDKNYREGACFIIVFPCGAEFISHNVVG